MTLDKIAADLKTHFKASSFESFDACQAYLCEMLQIGPERAKNGLYALIHAGLVFPFDDDIYFDEKVCLKAKKCQAIKWLSEYSIRPGDKLGDVYMEFCSFGGRLDYLLFKTLVPAGIFLE